MILLDILHVFWTWTCALQRQIRKSRFEDFPSKYRPIVCPVLFWDSWDVPNAEFHRKNKSDHWISKTSLRLSLKGWEWFSFYSYVNDGIKKTIRISTPRRCQMGVKKVILIGKATWVTAFKRSRFPQPNSDWRVLL